MENNEIEIRRLEPPYPEAALELLRKSNAEVEAADPRRATCAHLTLSMPMFTRTGGEYFCFDCLAPTLRAGRAWPCQHCGHADAKWYAFPLTQSGLTQALMIRMCLDCATPDVSMLN